MSKHTLGPWRVAPASLYTSGINVDSAVENKYVCLVAGNFDDEVGKADAILIAAAPELLEAQTMGASMNTPDFLDWIADRLVHQHHENPNVDYVLSLRERAAAGRAAIEKATGEKA